MSLDLFPNPHFFSFSFFAIRALFSSLGFCTLFLVSGPGKGKGKVAVVFLLSLLSGLIQFRWRCLSGFRYLHLSIYILSNQYESRTLLYVRCSLFQLSDVVSAAF